jgi:hypothetical protein
MWLASVCFADMHTHTYADVHACTHRCTHYTLKPPTPVLFSLSSVSQVALWMGSLLDLKMTGFVCASDGDIGRLGAGLAVDLWTMTGRSDAIARAAGLNDLGCASVAPSWCVHAAAAVCIAAPSQDANVCAG